MKKRVAFYTLGCKVNFCESESLQSLFENAGYRVTEFDNQADLYIINTCTVTQNSDHKSRKAIRKARENSPNSIILVTGCYAQRASEQLCEMKEVDLVIGTHDRHNLPGIVNSLKVEKKAINLVTPHDENPQFELPGPGEQRGRTRGFLKIQEGCNQQCSYCIVPQVRGPLRSLPPDEVLNRVQSLVNSGCCEIVLTGIHLGLYGADQPDTTLASLLRELETVPGLLRLRLSSIEPSDITTELVEQIIDSKIICPHLHIPLQSGDTEILRLMKRPYTPVEYLYLVRWLKQEMPSLALSSDLIVGFPGEGEGHHQRSMALVREIGFSRLHVFKYSSRPGTAAADLPDHVPNTVKERRSKEMIRLGEKLAIDFRRQFIGTTQPVLVEKVVPYSHGEGYSPHYLRVRFISDCKGLHWRGRLINVRLEKDSVEFVLASRLK